MHFRGLSKDKILSKNCVESYEKSCENKNQFKMVNLFGKKIETSGTNWLRNRSEEAITSSESGLLDLNETPVNEPVSNHHQCFSQDLNFPYTEDTGISNEKSDYMPIDGIESPSSCCTAENNLKIKREHSCEVIQIAAECLVHISAVSYNQSQESNNSSDNNSSEDEDILKKLEIGIEEPVCCSCDSYELHVLGIRETIFEDECRVSSKSINEFNNKKEFGVKLKRGKRRMKNFQKEILPELVSLSRNEIRKDMNILEAVLRSREYKKMQGTIRDGNKDFTKRYVCRRRRRNE